MYQHTNWWFLWLLQGIFCCLDCRWRVPASQWACCAAWVPEEMLLAGHMPSAVSHCSIPEQHSPVPCLPAKLVCREGSSAWLLLFPVWGPSQQQGATSSWRADVMVEGSKREEDAKCKCALDSRTGSFIYLCGGLLFSVVLWWVCGQ